VTRKFARGSRDAALPETLPLRASVSLRNHIPFAALRMSFIRWGLPGSRRGAWRRGRGSAGGGALRRERSAT